MPYPMVTLDGCCVILEYINYAANHGGYKMRVWMGDTYTVEYERFGVPVKHVHTWTKSEYFNELVVIALEDSSGSETIKVLTV